MTSLCAMLGLALFLGAAVGAAAQEPQVVAPDEAALVGLQINPLPYTATKPRIVPLAGNYWDLYPTREDVSIRDFRQLTGDQPGVLLFLRTGLKDFSHYRCTFKRDSLPDDPPQESRDGQIAIRFVRRDEPKAQLIRTEVRAVSKTGETSDTYSIEIGYYPKELYAASGQTSRSWLVVQNTDLVTSGSAVEDWILDEPTPEDRAYAQRRWSDLIGPLRTDLEKAQTLARSLMVALKTHRGIPSDRMLASTPFRQLDLAEAEQGGVACENYAAIFSWTCNAVGIPARRIGLNYPWSTDGTCNLEIAEGHNSTEIFDRDNNRWVWIDLSFNTLGAYLGDQGPLNMAELVQNLNDRGRVGALQIVEFDPDAGTERRLPAMDSRQKAALLKYFKKDQQFRYQRKP